MLTLLKRLLFDPKVAFGFIRALCLGAGVAAASGNIAAVPEEYQWLGLVLVGLGAAAQSSMVERKKDPQP